MWVIKIVKPLIIQGWMNHSFIYIVIAFFYFFIFAAAGAAAPGCSGTVNAAD